MAKSTKRGLASNAGEPPAKRAKVGKAKKGKAKEVDREVIEVESGEDPENEDEDENEGEDEGMRSEFFPLSF